MHKHFSLPCMVDIFRLCCCFVCVFSHFSCFPFMVLSGERLIGIPKKQDLKTSLPPNRTMMRIPIIVGAFVGSLQATIF